MDYFKLVDNMRKYFLKNKTKDVDFRIAALNKLKYAIEMHENDIMVAVSKDLGKCDFEAYSSEIAFVLHDIDYLIKNLKRLTRIEKHGTPLINLPAKSYVSNEPYGVVLIISPWNYPFQLMMSPLAGAIAAGNCCVLKPSEISENTSKIIAKIIAETFDENFVKVIEGDAQVSKNLLEVKFDYIFYTGSTNVGKIIMQAASKHLTPVTLELGGKSPTIVDNSANLKVAARRVAWGKFLNAGQTCIAPDYVYVQSDVREDFISYLCKAINDFYTIEPEYSKDYGRIVSTRHFERLASYLDGVEILKGGNMKKEEKFIEPTIIECEKDDKVMQEEIFGPILPIFEFDNIDEVINEINSRPKPLALYLFSKDDNIKQRVINETSSGGVCINDTISHIMGDMPFGGVGESGMGAYHGEHSFYTFTHKKAVLDKNADIDVKARYPPYKMSLDKVKKLMRFV